MLDLFTSTIVHNMNFKILDTAGQHLPDNQRLSHSDTNYISTFVLKTTQSYAEFFILISKLTETPFKSGGVFGIRHEILSLKVYVEVFISLTKSAEFPFRGESMFVIKTLKRLLKNHCSMFKVHCSGMGVQTLRGIKTISIISYGLHVLRILQRPRL